MIKKCDDCGIEIKTVAKCWGCEYFQKVINKSPKNLPKADSNAVLGEVLKEALNETQNTFTIRKDSFIEVLKKHYS
jgi:hypothetical protein